jgi:hypothetical protein
MQREKATVARLASVAWVVCSRARQKAYYHLHTADITAILRLGRSNKGNTKGRSVGLALAARHSAGAFSRMRVAASASINKSQTARGMWWGICRISGTHIIELMRRWTCYRLVLRKQLARESEIAIVRSSVDDGIVAHILCTQLRGTTAQLWFIFRLWLEDP